MNVLPALPVHHASQNADTGDLNHSHHYPSLLAALIPPDDLQLSSFMLVRVTPSTSASTAGDGDGELAGEGGRDESG